MNVIVECLRELVDDNSNKNRAFSFIIWNISKLESLLLFMAVIECNFWLDKYGGGQARLFMIWLLWFASMYLFFHLDFYLIYWDFFFFEKLTINSFNFTENPSEKISFDPSVSYWNKCLKILTCHDNFHTWDTNSMRLDRLRHNFRPNLHSMCRQNCNLCPWLDFHIQDERSACGKSQESVETVHITRSMSRHLFRNVLLKWKTMIMNKIRNLTTYPF